MEAPIKLERCDNCHKQFPSDKVNSHFSYCNRNIRRCKQCNEFIDINYEEDHIRDFHEKVACKFCSKPLTKQQAESHQANCLQKPKRCEYCETDVRRVDYDQHIASCGSRTKVCPTCRRNVVLREYEFHVDVCTNEEAQPTIKGSTGSIGQKVNFYSKPVIRQQEKKPQTRMDALVKQSILDGEQQSNNTRTEQHQQHLYQRTQIQQQDSNIGQRNAPPSSNQQHYNPYHQVQQASNIRTSHNQLPNHGQHIQNNNPQASRTSQQSNIIQYQGSKPPTKVTYPSPSQYQPVTQQSSLHQSGSLQHVQQASQLHVSNFNKNQPNKVAVSYLPQHVTEEDIDEDAEVQKAILQNIQKSRSRPGQTTNYSSNLNVQPSSHNNTYSHHHHQPQPQPYLQHTHHKPISESNLYQQPSSYISQHVNPSKVIHKPHPSSVEQSGEDLLNQSFYGDLEFQEQIEASLKKDHHHHRKY